MDIQMQKEQSVSSRENKGNEQNIPEASFRIVIIECTSSFCNMTMVNVL